MDLGTFSADVLGLLPVPCVALEPVSGDGASRSDMCVVWANAKAREVFGDGVEGARVDREQPFGVIGPITRQVELARRTGRPQVVERTGERDGGAVHLRCTVVPAVSGAALVLEDITVEADTRAELATMGSTLRRIEQWGNLGVWDLDLDSGALYWSTQVFEILGVQDQDLDQFYSVVHPDDRAMLDHVTRRVVAQPGPYRVVHRIMRDGDVRTVEQHMQSVPDAEGRPIRVLGTIVDVTATRALQQQVHHGQQMRTIGLLAGGVAHDLGNALLIMRGHAQALLSRTDLDDGVSDSLAAIARAGERASAVTRRFMALGRRDELRPAQIDPHKVLSDVRELVEPTFRPEVHVSLVRPPHLGTLRVLADPDRLRQVLLDLVLNARDAGATSIALRIGEATLHPADPRCGEAGLTPGHYGVIDVEDNGTGIAPGVVERVFDPFFTTKESDAGSGIGLANAKDFTSQSLGTILVSSTPGAGTTMSVLLPAATVPDQGSRRGRRPRRRVLVGARSPDQCSQLVDALAAHDIQVACMDGFESIGYSLETEPIDAVVLDESIIPPATWPDVLRRVPSVILATRTGRHPEATYELDRADRAGLLQVLDDLLVTAGGDPGGATRSRSSPTAEQTKRR